MYYDNILKKENTTLCFRSFENGDGVQTLMASMPDEHALREWELHTLEDVRWIDNYQCRIKYWSRDIMKSMRSWLRQAAYTEHLIYAPQRCINSDAPQKRLCTDMHTADWWWDTQVRRDTWG